MFPTQALKFNEVLKEDNKTTNNGKSFLFDFKTGEFDIKDGKITVLNDLAALKMWIEKILKTEKFKFKIYENIDYGVSLLELITSDFPLAFIQAELEREVTETLLKNSNIKSVQNFEFERNKKTLIIRFSIFSNYGNTKMEVLF